MPTTTSATYAQLSIKNASIAMLTYDKATNKYTYATPTKVPNLMKVGINPVVAEGKQFGDGKQSRTASKVSAINLAVEWNRLPLDVQAKLFGRTIGQDGTFEIGSADVPQPFAFGYEEELDGGQSEFCWYYYCLAKPLAKDSEQATDNIKYGSHTLNIVCTESPVHGKFCKIGDTTQTGFTTGTTWFNAVPVPTP